METIRVWFYDPTRDKDGLFNKMVAYADPPFCHCELQFEDLTACSIYVGSKVVMKARHFDTAFYTAVTLSVSHEDASRAHKVCSDKQALGVVFSSMQMLSCLYTWQALASDKKHTFCSRLVAEMLVAAKVLPDDTSCSMTPSALYRTLVALQTRQSAKCEALELKEGVSLQIL